MTTYTGVQFFFRGHSVDLKYYGMSVITTYQLLPWRRQLWGTVACAPSLTSNCLFFSGHFKAAQTLTFDSVWLPIPRKNTQA